MKNFKNIIAAITLLVVSAFAFYRAGAYAQSSSVLYVPLIGITSVPDPLSLPDGEGTVTYHYAVKNFLSEIPLTHIRVTDDTCSPVKFTHGDDNNDTKLDFSETWRYSCTTKITKTTKSTATAAGIANNISATHNAYATVVVGSHDPPPLVSIVNITKVAHPLSLPKDGGMITFTYKVSNPGVVPLNDVTVTDNKCAYMSGKLGDRNANNLLDTNEVWIYTCTANLTQTTTNTVNVTAFANGLKAVDNATITVKVDIPDSAVSPTAQTVPRFPNVGGRSDIKIVVWKIMSGLLVVLILLLIFTRKNKLKMPKKHELRHKS